jgi:hypothetical protein
MLLSIEKIKRLGWSPELGSARAREVAVKALLKEN